MCRRPKKSFFLMVGPFLDLLPFKGPFPLTGPLWADRLTGRLLMRRFLTGRPLYGEASYGSLWEGPGSLTGPFTQKDDEEAYGKALW